MDERNDGQKLQKASLDDSGDAEVGGTNDVVSFERIDQVYRRLDLRIIPGASPWLCHYHTVGRNERAILRSGSVLDPVLPLFSHSIQCRSCTDYEP